MKAIVIEDGDKKWIVTKGKNDKKPIVIEFGQDYCTGLPWPAQGNECAIGYEEYENNGEICCRASGSPE